MMRFNSTPVGPSVLRTPYLVLVVFALLLANFTSHVAAADDNKKPEKPAPELTLERIFSGSEFNAKDAAYQWKDEQSFWNWDSSAGGL
ncbi:MAG: hypothetical protein KDB23_31610, partial [Planctomycetales bacterium]|nr:hypothetical protein [Planctomycetales bacterium]